MKKILAAIVLASLLLASCNAADTTESSDSSVETVVIESSESTPESSSSEASEEVSAESEEESQPVSESSETSEVSEPESSAQTATVYTGSADTGKIGGPGTYFDYTPKYMAIPGELCTYIGDDIVQEWADETSWNFNLQMCIEHFNLTSEEIISAINAPDTTDNPDLDLTTSEIKILCSGDQAAINRAFVSEYAALSETGDIYTIFWLGEHTAEDYEAAGLTADAIASAIENCQTLGIEAVNDYCTQAQTALATFEAEQ